MDFLSQDEVDALLKGVCCPREDLLDQIADSRPIFDGPADQACAAVLMFQPDERSAAGEIFAAGGPAFEAHAQAARRLFPGLTSRGYAEALRQSLGAACPCLEVQAACAELGPGCPAVVLSCAPKPRHAPAECRLAALRWGQSVWPKCLLKTKSIDLAPGSAPLAAQAHALVEALALASLARPGQTSKEGSSKRI